MATKSAANTGSEFGSGLRIGVLTGAVAWACCISAVVLGFLGASAAAAFMAEVQEMYHWWLVGVAFIFMDISIYYYMKQYHGACNFKTIQHNSTPLIVIALIAVLAYFLLSAILTPLMPLAGIHMMMGM